MNVKIILFMALIILFTIFVVQNTEPVSMNVFFWHISEFPKIILLTITLMIGIISGLIISAILKKRKKAEEIKPVNLNTPNEENIFK